MKKIFGCILLILFTLQLGVKSMVAGYFKWIDRNKAVANCQYKNITVCKGSCYVVKQIKIFSSESSSKKRSVPQIDLSTLKDVISEDNKLFSLVKLPSMEITQLNKTVNLYSFQPSFNLIKPPCA